MAGVRRNRPPVITDAEYSQDTQLQSRELRYVIMMAIRAACLVLAAILVAVHAPLLKLWLPLLIFGMVVLPWLAVILANERPAKRRSPLSNRLHRSHVEEPTSQPAITTAQYKVIDEDDAGPGA